MVPRQRRGDDLPRAEPPPLVLNSKLTEGGTAMRRRIVAFTVAALLTEAAGVSAQIYAPQSVERYFRLEWEVTRGRKGPAVEGYVYNTGPRNAEHMRLQIERLDVSGKVVASSTVWVLGGVPMDGRAYFRASVSDAASYRVQVLSFDWAGGSCGGSGSRATRPTRTTPSPPGGAAAAPSPRRPPPSVRITDTQPATPPRPHATARTAA